MLAQCSATLVTCTVTLVPSVYKTVQKFFVLLRQKSGTAEGSGGIETYRNGVWCEVFSVENCSERIRRHIWDNDIKVEYCKDDWLFMNLVSFL